MGLLPPPVVRLKRALHVDARKSRSVKEKGMVGNGPGPVKRGSGTPFEKFFRRLSGWIVAIYIARVAIRARDFLNVAITLW
jgi:hypothetical protein